MARHSSTNLSVVALGCLMILCGTLVEGQTQTATARLSGSQWNSVVSAQGATLNVALMSSFTIYFGLTSPGLLTVQSITVGTGELVVVMSIPSTTNTALAASTYGSTNTWLAPVQAVYSIVSTSHTVTMTSIAYSGGGSSGVGSTPQPAASTSTMTATARLSGSSWSSVITQQLPTLTVALTSSFTIYFGLTSPGLITVQSLSVTSNELVVTLRIPSTTNTALAASTYGSTNTWLAPVQAVYSIVAASHTVAMTSISYGSSSSSSAPTPQPATPIASTITATAVLDGTQWSAIIAQQSAVLGITLTSAFMVYFSITSGTLVQIQSFTPTSSGLTVVMTIPSTTNTAQAATTYANNHLWLAPVQAQYVPFDSTHTVRMTSITYGSGGTPSSPGGGTGGIPPPVPTPVPTQARQPLQVVLSGSSSVWASIISEELQSLASAALNGLNAKYGTSNARLDNLESSAAEPLVITGSIPSGIPLTTEASSTWENSIVSMYNTRRSASDPTAAVTTVRSVTKPTRPPSANQPVAPVPPVNAPGAGAGQSPGQIGAPGSSATSVTAPACGGGCAAVIILSLAIVGFIIGIAVCAFLTCQRRSERQKKEAGGEHFSGHPWDRPSNNGNAAPTSGNAGLYGNGTEMSPATGTVYAQPAGYANQQQGGANPIEAQPWDPVNKHNQGAGGGAQGYPTPPPQGTTDFSATPAYPDCPPAQQGGADPYGQRQSQGPPPAYEGSGGKNVDAV